MTDVLHESVRVFYAPHVCPDCGSFGGSDATWRWSGERWQHRCAGVHAQAGHWEIEPLDVAHLLAENKRLKTEVQRLTDEVMYARVQRDIAQGWWENHL